MTPDDVREELTLSISGVEPWQPPDGQAGDGLMLHTTRGPIEAILHHDPETPTRAGIVWVWGARGGFDGPADGVYGALAEELKTGITSLRVNYRYPGVLPESVMDTLAGVSFLSGTGHTEIALVGHSFGGAVVIASAPFSDSVKAVAALSSQTAGASRAADVAPRPLLLVHGEADTRLPPYCTEMIFEWASRPKRKIIYPGAGHGLRECADEVRGLLRDFLTTNLLPEEP